MTFTIPTPKTMGNIPTMVKTEARVHHAPNITIDGVNWGYRTVLFDPHDGDRMVTVGVEVALDGGTYAVLDWGYVIRRSEDHLVLAGKKPSSTSNWRIPGLREKDGQYSFAWEEVIDDVMAHDWFEVQARREVRRKRRIEQGRRERSLRSIGL